MGLWKEHEQDGGDRSLRPRSNPAHGRASGVSCTALVGGQGRGRELEGATSQGQAASRRAWVLSPFRSSELASASGGPVVHQVCGAWCGGLLAHQACGGAKRRPAHASGLRDCEPAAPLPIRLLVARSGGPLTDHDCD
jgi:hypothetical protein